VEVLSVAPAVVGPLCALFSPAVLLLSSLLMPQKKQTLQQQWELQEFPGCESKGQTLHHRPHHTMIRLWSLFSAPKVPV